MAPMIISQCQHCGSAFQHLARERRRFCSHQCSDTHQRRPLAERLAYRVHSGTPDTCWPWTGPMNGKYGEIGSGGRGRPLLAHRAAWEVAHGPIPAGLQVLHRCDNPKCCNPQHLFLGTQLDNMRDMITKDRGSRGERHYSAKVTDAQVREIRTSAETGRTLARRFGLSFQTLSNIRTGRSWKHVR